NRACNTESEKSAGAAPSPLVSRLLLKTRQEPRHATSRNPKRLSRRSSSKVLTLTGFLGKEPRNDTIFLKWLSDFAGEMCHWRTIPGDKIVARRDETQNYNSNSARALSRFFRRTLRVRGRGTNFREICVICGVMLFRKLVAVAIILVLPSVARAA